MSNAELWDLDTSGGIMEQIQMLVAPPVSSDALRRSRRRRDPYRRPGRAVNHDCCDSCKEGGDLLCCDRCPAAFHLLCHDPPLIEEELPPGEWLCHKCKIAPTEGKEDDTESSSSKSSGRSFRGKRPITNAELEPVTEHPLKILAKAAKLMNPAQFDVGKEMACSKPLPGSSKRMYGGRAVRFLPKKQAHELDNGLVPLPAKTCFSCNKSCRIAPLIQCDYCPLLFHLDCLNPPLTSLPTGRWMCPNHVEHFLDSHLLKSQSLTERLKLWDRYTGLVDSHTVKVDFLKKVHRKHPMFRLKRKLPPRPTLTVPPAIKMFYDNPVTLLPDPLKPSVVETTTDLPGTRSSSNCRAATFEEQEEWLSSVVSMQSSIAKHLAQKQLQRSSEENKTLETTVVKPTASVAPVVQKDTDSSTSLSGSVHFSSLGKTTSSSLLSPAATLNANDSTICDNKQNSNLPLNLDPKTSVNSMLQTNGSLSNGPLEVPATSAVSLLSNNLTSVHNAGAFSSLNGDVSRPDVQLSSGPDSRSVMRARSNSVDSASSPLMTSSNPSIESDVNVSNTSFGNGSSNKNVLVSTLTKHTSVVTKVLPGVPPHSTKVILPGGKTSIITNSNTTQRVVVQPSSKPSTSNSGTAPKVITVSAPPSVRPLNNLMGPNNKVANFNSLSSSPTIVNLNSMLQQWIEGNSDFELTKIDEKLTQILAWQRLQQLLPSKSASTPTLPTASSTTASSVPLSSSTTSSFSSKRGLVNGYLSQQDQSEVRSRAALCPIPGKGEVITMPYRSLSLGTGSDMDVCLSHYGFCNFISGHHATIFYDEMTRHFELLNYSEHGTAVDNVLYSCDFSDKPATTPQISPLVSSVREIINKGSSPRDGSKTSKDSEADQNKTSKLRMCPKSTGFAKPCNCKFSGSSLIGGNGAGWEGTALLHHGSYIKVGCLQFVFSIIDHAPELPIPPPASTSELSASSRLSSMPLISSSPFLHQSSSSPFLHQASSSLLKSQLNAAAPP